MTRIGVQCFGLGKELNISIEETVKTLKTIGFDCLEIFYRDNEKQGKISKNFATKETIRQFYDLSVKYELPIVAAHLGAGVGPFLMPSGQIINSINYLNENFKINNFVFSGIFKNRFVTDKWIKLFNELKTHYQSSNINIIYHNHSEEFAKLKNGQTCLQYFLNKTGNDTKLEFDIGWAGYENDEVQLVEQHKDNIYLLHLKDVYQTATDLKNRHKMSNDMFAPIGEGAIKTKECLALLKKLEQFEGTVIFDQDNCANDMIDDLKIGYKNIRGMLNE